MACAVAAMACLAILDSANKYLTVSVPLLMVLWFRYVFQAVATTAVMWPRRGWTLFQTHQYKLQLVRGVMLLVCSWLGFASLQRMPVAEFSAIAMLTPLVVTLMARFILKEQVSRLRWLFVLGGLLGALLIVRPGGSVAPDAAWLPLSMVLVYAAFQILTSRMAKTEDLITMHIYTGWVGTAVASVLVLGAWTTDLTPFEWLLMGLVGFAGTLGHYLLIIAFSRAPASSVSPFLYSSIAFGTLSGWLVFSHIPDRWATLGILLIALCGLGAGWLSQREVPRTHG
jgi:drug/metabolite transporter (DMT)-like permease